VTGEVSGGFSGWKLTDDYARSVGRLAYLWGWPLVNMHNRLSIGLPARGEAEARTREPGSR
jgi:hypothetical protein